MDETVESMPRKGGPIAWLLIFAALAVLIVGACAFGLALAVAGGAW